MRAFPNRSLKHIKAGVWCHRPPIASPASGQSDVGKTTARRRRRTRETSRDRDGIRISDLEHEWIPLLQNVHVSIARVLPGEILFVFGGLGAFPQEHRYEIGATVSRFDSADVAPLHHLRRWNHKKTRIGLNVTCQKLRLPGRVLLGLQRPEVGDAQHPSSRPTLVRLVGQMTETSWPSICEVTSLAAQPPAKRRENSVSQSDPPLVDPAPPLGHFTHSGWNAVITVYHGE